MAEIVHPTPETEDKSLTAGELQNIHSAYRLNGKNYLKWSQLIRTILKGKGKGSHLTNNAPDEKDAKFKSWDEEDSMIMAWLWNSMILEISDTCMFLKSAKEIWEAVEQTYSKAKDAAQIYEVRIQILGKEKVPGLNEVIAIVRSEESRRELMLETPTTENSAMIAEGGTTMVANQKKNREEDEPLMLPNMALGPEIGTTSTAVPERRPDSDSAEQAPNSVAGPAPKPVTNGGKFGKIWYIQGKNRPFQILSMSKNLTHHHYMSTELLYKKDDPATYDSHLIAALGINWAHAVTIRLVLEAKSGQRFIKLAKSPISPPLAFPFNITSSGIILLDDNGIEIKGPEINTIHYQGLSLSYFSDRSTE
ncbi:DNA recombination and repair protein Rad51-like, C-terminal [Sesbania bispinosa]|nr:DNA recombination and repair protein Rad51-like, C-terminal [Sesbania bispinosa]